MTIRVVKCLPIFTILFLNTCLTACANPSYTVWGNGTHVSMRVTVFLPNGTLVELCLVNNVSSTVFKPESFKIGVEDSTLLVKYDTRFSGSPSEGMLIDEAGNFFQNDSAKYLPSIMFFAAGLILLVWSIIGSRKSEKVLLKNMENGYLPPKGSVLSEEVLLLLASRNPDAYRRVLGMVLKGELKVEKPGWSRKALLLVRRLLYGGK
ncbi:MAG: hypothetical protein ACP5PQ_00735 [Thermoproteota archaeon]